MSRVGETGAKQVDAVEADFRTFWEPIVKPGGEWDMEQVKRELFDYQHMLREVAKVYESVTNGVVSKPNTSAHAVITEHDERCWYKGQADRLEEAASALLDSMGKDRALPPTNAAVDALFEVLYG